MLTGKNQNLVKKTTAFFGAIAAGSLLAVPAFAGGMSNSQSEQPSSDAGTAPLSAQCSTPYQSSQSSMSTSSTAYSNNGMGNSAMGNSMNSDQQAANSAAVSGVGNPNELNSNVLANGGATSGRLASQQFEAANGSKSAQSMAATERPISYTSADMPNRPGAGNRTQLYRDVLANGGATSGRNSSRQFEAANAQTRPEGASSYGQMSDRSNNGSDQSYAPSTSYPNTTSQSSNQSGMSQSMSSNCAPGMMQNQVSPGAQPQSPDTAPVPATQSNPGQAAPASPQAPVDNGGMR